MFLYEEMKFSSLTCLNFLFCLPKMSHPSIRYVIPPFCPPVMIRGTTVVGMLLIHFLLPFLSRLYKYDQIKGVSGPKTHRLFKPWEEGVKVRYECQIWVRTIECISSQNGSLHGQKGNTGDTFLILWSCCNRHDAPKYSSRYHAGSSLPCSISDRMEISVKFIYYTVHQGDWLGCGTI